MFLAIVDGRLIALESGFVNPLQPNLLIDWDTIARHVKPTDGKLRLGIAAVGCQLVPENTLRQVFLYTIAVPVGLPEESLVVIHFSTVSKIVSIGHIHL